MIDPLIVMAFTTGLLGAGHCIGMCGGLIGALSLSATGRPGGWSFHLLYNAGRIATYTVIGALVGWLGSALAYTDRFREVTRRRGAGRKGTVPPSGHAPRELGGEPRAGRADELP